MTGFDATIPEVIVVSDEVYDRVIEIIEDDSEPSPALVALMQREPLWVKQ